MIKTIIPNILYQGPRPGYNIKNYNVMNKLSIYDVYRDLCTLSDKNIKTIFCLLTNDEISKYYNFDLISEYKKLNFNVIRYPVNDDKYMSSHNKRSFFNFITINQIMENIPVPIYLHCSAGKIRSKDLAEFLYPKLRNTFQNTNQHNLLDLYQ